MIQRLKILAAKIHQNDHFWTKNETSRTQREFARICSYKCHLQHEQEQWSDHYYAMRGAASHNADFSKSTSRGLSNNIIYYWRWINNTFDFASSKTPAHLKSAAVHWLLGLTATGVLRPAYKLREKLAAMRLRYPYFSVCRQSILRFYPTTLTNSSPQNSHTHKNWKT